MVFSNCISTLNLLDVPEERIRERYARSLSNLLRLMPSLTELRLYDNSTEADPHTGAHPEPRLIVHMDRCRLKSMCDLALTPDWAKPVVMCVLQVFRT